MGWFEERGGLDGKVAVVTGGAGGLGEAISFDLATNGVRLAVIDVDGNSVDALRQSSEERGWEAVIHGGDARDQSALEALFTAVDARWKRLDILVNVVGGTFFADFSESRPKGWDALLRTNLFPVLHACSMAIPRIRVGGRGGSIVNLTTVEAHRAAPGYAVYSAAKSAVEHFARSLAVELAPDGIRVNNVAPDYAPTVNMQKIVGRQTAADTPLGARIRFPMGRPGRPTDISNCVVFLASDLSAYVTGTTLHPDGGTLASSGWFNWPGTGWDTVPMQVVEYLAAGQNSLETQ